MPKTIFMRFAHDAKLPSPSASNFYYHLVSVIFTLVKATKDRALKKFDYILQWR